MIDPQKGNKLIKARKENQRLRMENDILRQRWKKPSKRR